MHAYVTLQDVTPGGARHVGAKSEIHREIHLCGPSISRRRVPRHSAQRTWTPRGEWLSRSRAFRSCGPSQESDNVSGSSGWPAGDRVPTPFAFQDRTILMGDRRAPAVVVYRCSDSRGKPGISNAVGWSGGIPCERYRLQRLVAEAVVMCVLDELGERVFSNSPSTSRTWPGKRQNLAIQCHNAQFQQGRCEHFQC